jgi:hypothetical protein
MVLSNLSNISPRIPEREMTSSYTSNQQESPLSDSEYKSISSQQSPSDASDSEQEEEEHKLSSEEEELGTRIREIGGETETEDDEEEDARDHEESEESKGEDEDGEEEFSSHFERMKMQMEEPAFLPRKMDQSRQLSVSMQQSKREHTPTQGSPAAQPVTPSSALNSVGSSFSDLSGKREKMYYFRM